MKYIVLLKDVYLDINGGEYSENVPEPLYLGIVEAETEEEAETKGDKLKELSYEENYTNDYLMGNPYISVLKI